MFRKVIFISFIMTIGIECAVGYCGVPITGQQKATSTATGKANQSIVTAIVTDKNVLQRLIDADASASKGQSNASNSPATTVLTASTQPAIYVTSPYTIPPGSKQRIDSVVSDGVVVTTTYTTLGDGQEYITRVETRGKSYRLIQETSYAQIVYPVPSGPRHYIRCSLDENKYLYNFIPGYKYRKGGQEGGFRYFGFDIKTRDGDWKTVYDRYDHEHGTQEQRRTVYNPDGSIESVGKWKQVGTF